MLANISTYLYASTDTDEYHGPTRSHMVWLARTTRGARWASPAESRRARAKWLQCLLPSRHVVAVVGLWMEATTRAYLAATEDESKAIPDDTIKYVLALYI